MTNILLCLAEKQGLSSQVIHDIKDKITVDSLFMIVASPEELPKYEIYGECILRVNAAKGIYTDAQLDLENCIPLDDNVLQYMNQHSTMIMHQQRRFEQYPGVRIDSDWNSHYTVYMHNLFFWYNLLKRRQITHVFLSAVPHEGYDCIIYYLCKYLNIPILIMNHCFIPFRYYMLNDFMVDEPTLTAEYARLTTQYAQSKIEDIPLEGDTEQVFAGWISLQPDQMKPWYMRVDPFSRRLRQRFNESNVIRIWRGILGEDYVKYGASPAFLRAAVCKIPKLLEAIPIAWKRWIYVWPVRRESIEQRKYYQSLAGEPVKGERYIYFPLHYQPEASSNPMGGDMYADQIIPLNILSRSLPDDMKIYVKIHPEQLSPMRTREYYTETAKIPKVRFMKVETSTYDLMRNAVAVATLTGTALWECQFFGVPALAFGYSVKNSAPLAYHVRTVEECRKALAQIALEPRRDVTKELKIYTKAVHNISFAEESFGEKIPEMVVKFVRETVKEE